LLSHKRESITKQTKNPMITVDVEKKNKKNFTVALPFCPDI
jgi:hypothetical protein